MRFKIFFNYKPTIRFKFKNYHEKYLFYYKKMNENVMNKIIYE